MDEHEEHVPAEINVESEEYVDMDSAADVIPDDPEDADHEMSDASDGEDVDGEDEEAEEIDMSNNSTTYFDRHKDSIFMIATHPSLPLAVTGGGDDIGYVWTTHSVPPKLVTTLSGHTDSLISGGFTADGEWLVTGGMDGKIRIWRARSRGQKWEFKDSIEEVEEVTWLSFHPTQPIFAFGANDGSAWVYSLASKVEQLCVLYGHSGVCTAGEFIPVAELASSPDEEEINLVTIAEDGCLISWSIPAGVPNYRLDPSQFHFEAVWVSLKLHPTGTSVAIGSVDGKVSVIGLRTGSIIASIDVLEAAGKADMADEEKSIESLSWCDTMNILAVGMVAGLICLFDTGSWRLRRSLEVPEAVTKLEFVPGSTDLIVSSMDGVLLKFDARIGSETWKGTGHSSGILDFSIANSGHTIITASDEGVALVYNI
ncbi:WD40-repeat-containing domain protein [Dipodascopsis uninucleata]